MFLKTSEKNNLINEGSKSFLAFCWINKNINNYIESKSDNSPLDSLQKNNNSILRIFKTFQRNIKNN